MYCNTLSITTPTGLLDVLMVVGKFEIASCMRYCSNELQKQQVAIESTLLYLDLPFKVSMVDVVQLLIDVARLNLRFRDINK
ncbi:hypothetical protein H5410_012775 [Solanum commersonii]|uniref:Uncharacterized protein n=1 Tax=Solanum commersonii TaxID=4109 RepID=A0A9J6ASJ6_SOLCO|nr:hypothetical protein H5410_012775 [Solanum commersonii]